MKLFDKILDKIDRKFGKIKVEIKTDVWDMGEYLTNYHVSNALRRELVEKFNNKLNALYDKLKEMEREKSV